MNEGTNRTRPLTPTQRDVLAFIRGHVETCGWPPSQAEICARFGWRSENSARSVVAALERKGRLERVPGVARGLRIVEPTEGGAVSETESVAASPVFETAAGPLEVPPPDPSDEADDQGPEQQGRQAPAWWQSGDAVAAAEKGGGQC